MHVKQFKFVVISLCFLLIVFASSCSSSDGTFSLFPLSMDEYFGEQAVQQIVDNPKQFDVLDENEYGKAYAHLRRIRDKLLESGQIKHKDDFKWELRIIRDDSVLNAFCLPGGYIFVYTGLIKFLDSEDELAGVRGPAMCDTALRRS